MLQGSLQLLRRTVWLSSGWRVLPAAQQHPQSQSLQMLLPVFRMLVKLWGAGFPCRLTPVLADLDEHPRAASGAPFWKEAPVVSTGCTVHSRRCAASPVISAHKN